MNKILVTGAGGTAGVNFTRAVKLDDSIQVTGTELNKYHEIFANDIDIVSVPPANDTSYIQKINNIVEKYGISFIHPQPTPELQAIVQHKNELKAKTFLPEKEVVLKDKLEQQETLQSGNIAVAKTFRVQEIDSLKSFENSLRYPVWVELVEELAAD